MQKTALETLHDKAPELLPQQGSVWHSVFRHVIMVAVCNRADHYIFAL